MPLLVALPNCWLPALHAREAVLALVARDLATSGGGFLYLRLFGEPALVPPLAPWLMALADTAWPLAELGVRLVGLLPLALLGLLGALVARAHAGPLAGAAAGAAIVASAVSLKFAMRGTPDLLFALLINGAWLAWYVGSREQKRWLLAWGLGHALVAAALLAGGGKALFYFYFPLLFLRRPLSMWRRLRQADHWLSLACLVVLAALWLAFTPNPFGEADSFLRRVQTAEDSIGYLKGFLLFPLWLLIGYLPQCFLAWPAFCMAFRPLEADAVLGQYLRTIVYALFLFFWFFPDGRPADLLPLVGPLGILVGLNYATLVRRYARQLHLLVRALAWLAVVAVVLAVMPGSLVLVQALRESAAPGAAASLPPLLIVNAVLLLLALGLAVALLRLAAPRQLWLTVLAGACACHLAGVAVIFHSYEYVQKCRGLAPFMAMAQSLPATARVYEMIDPRERFEIECYYLRRPVQQVAAADDIPFDSAPVYVLGTNRVPVSKLREWVPAGPEFTYGRYRLQLWRGALRRRVPPPAPVPG